MEPTKDSHLPSNWHSRLYSKCRPPSNADRMIDVTGETFCYGTGGGMFYHFIKSGRHQPLVPRIKAACAKSPRVGGFCATLFLLSDIPYCFSDVPSHMTLFASSAAVAALMWSPKGIRAASLAAFLFPTVPMGMLALVFLQGPSLYVFKGLSGRFTLIGVHLAMLLIMVGATFSATRSFRGSVNVPQGLNFVVSDVSPTKWIPFKSYRSFQY